ncbi:hypothetical protein [Alterisphingorhabdus coralli]|uniref:Uncharacterized protein n=1 Tax=Alterisphingorhabdus coralli TaxID=3071408 RepID=A0AA97F6R6_9SPHN|nr:hypothetical protein [Parasphingorhabdus sp. SCSIO 66989]WOE75399.1 hypothetical protein RB602_01390 [Parasphingorhabdus sp. SCSIO 66989]
MLKNMMTVASSAILAAGVPALAFAKDDGAPLLGMPEADESALSLLEGTFSNEEHVYFEKEADRPAPPWMSLNISEEEDVLWLREVDAYGAELAQPQQVSFAATNNRAVLSLGDCKHDYVWQEEGWSYAPEQHLTACHQRYTISRIDDGGLTVQFVDGQESSLKRARQVQCWAAIPKKEKKEGGSTDWYFANKLEIHDQGGRVRIGGDESGAEEAILRMRQVYWPQPSRNRPSLVLYISKPDNPDRSVSYSWADVDATRVGINLRWMQASCTVVGAELQSPSSPIR